MPNDGSWRGNYLSQPNLFNPDSSGVGLFKIFYDRTDQNGCTITKEVNINIQALPTFYLKDSSTFCTDGGSILLTKELVTTFVPNGSTTTFYINNIQVPENYNLNSLAPNTYNVKAIHQQGECTVSDTGRIHIIAKTTLSLPPNDTVCINDGTFQLTASPTGGSWSGPGVNPATGVIDLNMAKGGVKMYNYVFEKGTSCEVSGSVNIKINDPANNLNIGADTAFCYGPTALALTASPGNGTWNGQGVQPSFGIIDLTQLKTDTTYTYQYCVNDNAISNCQACKEKKITIHSLPQPTFLKDSTNCIGEVITFTNTTPPGSYDPATVSWNFGNGNTSHLDPAVTQSYASKNNYTVALTLKNYNGCSNTYSQTIRVTTKPTIGSNLMLPPVHVHLTL
ncbi:MAG: PKD domain-containing protein [Saprospiraceae bacterium]|nr:PKD domain-containing protein [Saprospiraceae bacterium]